MLNLNIKVIMNKKESDIGSHLEHHMYTTNSLCNR